MTITAFLRSQHILIPLPLEYETIEAKLRARSITGHEASQAIFVARRRLGSPWHWKSWKAARKQVLRSACETCGAGEEAILYVQHTVRLPSISTHKELAKRNLAGREIEPIDYSSIRQQMYAIRDAAEPEERDCCPKCASLSIQYRKQAATWICNSKSTGRYCAHVFTVPAKKAALTADQKKSINREKHRTWRNTILNREDDWMRDAMLAWIGEMRVYLSLQHTKTLCKRCAFLEDMTDQKPCRSCGFAYPRTEQVCPDCEQPDGAQPIIG
ncbi:hypothetical protein [Microvirga brassicacearum]|uniref:Uncharacterized protein n=1 Tax=Microvirga brassicacearum TaxID=2580413 RepID=A0A5N3PC40_9HYPH|nr:hypothetical protein [Microvirga brassicacearum]KAB0267273.1 hypothetical protein FEZ63_08085 [Microvirga brassicacearum]